MDALYVIPDCPGEDPAGDWQEMGWDTPVNAAIGHLGWCRNHPPGALQSSAAIKAWRETRS